MLFHSPNDLVIGGSRVVDERLYTFGMYPHSARQGACLRQLFPMQSMSSYLVTSWRYPRPRFAWSETSSISR
jgi:hypothetical protein